MEPLHTKRPLRYWMRILHRDLGFFAIGLTLIFSISGILLIYRSTGLLKARQEQTLQLQPGLTAQELSKTLRIGKLSITSEDAQTLYFQQGNYNKVTGEARYTTRDWIYPFNKFNRLHKLGSSNALHYISVMFAVVLILLAISSLFMLPKGRTFTRAVVLVALGLLVATGSILML